MVPGMGSFGLWVNCPYAPTNPTIYTTTISRFWCNFFPRMAPHFFGDHDSPRNVAESRYPPPVTGLPIKDCAVSCNSHVQTCTKVNAKYVIPQTFFERLYLVSGLGKFGPWVNCPCSPIPPPFNQHLFLDFRVPQFCCQLDSLSNLAESQYSSGGASGVMSILVEANVNSKTNQRRTFSFQETNNDIEKRIQMHIEGLSTLRILSGQKGQGPTQGGYYCSSICVRSWCNWRAGCVDSKPSGRVPVPSPRGWIEN